MPPIWIVAVTAVFAVAIMLLVVGVLTLDLVSLALAALLFWLGLRLRTHARTRTGATGVDATTPEDAGGDSDADNASAGQTSRSEQADESADHDGATGQAVATDAADADESSPVVGEDGLELAAAEPATSVSEEGSVLHGFGHCLRQPGSGEPVELEQLDFSRDGIQAIRVLTPAENRDELQATDLDPGQPVALVPQRAPGQAARVRVFDDTIDHLAGWLPDAAAADLAPMLQRGVTVRAVSFYEWRDDDGQRHEMSVLVYRPDALVGD